MWTWVHLPPYWSEIPAPPAPSYLQARQPKATKQSPPRAATRNPAVKSPKAKHSGGKGGHHCSSGHSSNTSTPKHPDSTSAKKPSSSKEPTPNEQEKSPRSCHSRKHGHSPSPTAESVGQKWKGVCTEDTCTLNSTLPISSSMFDGFRSPMGSHSDVTELQPPSITLTPLGLGTPRQWRTTSEESRHSLVLLYTSPSFNFPGHPVAGPGNLTPSLAGSHHVSILAAECLALGVKLAKQFQMLLGLEASAPQLNPRHKTLTLGHSAQEATYSAILQDRVSENDWEAMTHCFHSEPDAAWKEMHEVMYNHQLQYDQQLATFLTEAKMALNDM